MQLILYFVFSISFRISKKKIVPPVNFRFGKFSVAEANTNEEKKFFFSLANRNHGIHKKKKKKKEKVIFFIKQSINHQVPISQSSNHPSIYPISHYHRSS